MPFQPPVINRSLLNSYCSIIFQLSQSSILESRNLWKRLCNCLKKWRLLIHFSDNISFYPQMFFYQYFVFSAVVIFHWKELKKTGYVTYHTKFETLNHEVSADEFKQIIYNCTTQMFLFINILFLPLSSCFIGKNFKK